MSNNTSTSSDFSEDLHIEQELHFNQCTFCGQLNGSPECKCDAEFERLRDLQNIIESLQPSPLQLNQSHSEEQPIIDAINVAEPYQPYHLRNSTPPLLRNFHNTPIDAQTQTEDQLSTQAQTQPRPQAQPQAQDLSTSVNASKIKLYSPLTQYYKIDHKTPLLAVYDIRNLAEINLHYGVEFLIETNIFISSSNKNDKLILKISSLKNTIYENFTTYFVGFNENYISEKNRFFQIEVSSQIYKRLSQILYTSRISHRQFRNNPKN